MDAEFIGDIHFAVRTTVEVKIPFPCGPYFTEPYEGTHYRATFDINICTYTYMYTYVFLCIYTDALHLSDKTSTEAGNGAS